ncbi:MAG: Uncharacterised protein [Owenweeksia sp. TMED14]|nr:MAG: Uncharacterised protein [Owenweeksia sp. TMED14]|tara:strand:- start:4296 stop:4955 length:660 start_codon:yes stop_codon:yes gene_type:complete
MNNGLQQKYIGDLITRQNDLFFLIAIILTLFLAFFFQRNYPEKRFWTTFFQQIDKLGNGPKYIWIINLTLLSLAIGIYGGIYGEPIMLKTFIHLNIPQIGIYIGITIIISVLQFFFQLFCGRIWGLNDLHHECWRIRFNYLSLLLVALPIIVWVFIWGQNDQKFLDDLIYHITLISITLYVLGILRSAINYVQKSATPSHLAFSYLCALEMSPIFWTLF